MTGPISRKQFFRQTFAKSAKLSIDLLDAFQPATEPCRPPSNHAFEADFPPELLAEEAVRLGINPEDKTAVLAAISERLEAPRN